MANSYNSNDISILLNEAKSVVSSNVSNTLNISLDRNVRILPYTDFTGIVNLNDVYDEERYSTNKYRLMISIHPYCTNVLFNNFTEIVKFTQNQEGDDNGYWEILPYANILPGDILNTGNGNAKAIEPLNTEYEPYKYKGTGYTWCAERGVQDTQLSNPNWGWTYYCGLNIFNNHLLRKNTFKCVSRITNSGATKNTREFTTDYPTDFSKIIEMYPDENNDSIMGKFNTIEDYMREFDGRLSISYSDIKYSKEPNLPLHLYLKEDIDTFKDSVEHNLKEKDGWYGFTNEATIETYVDDEEEVPEELGINMPINSSKACEFVYMYPTPDLFEFTPKYNPYRRRIEKNWNYCLTYPSSSTTVGFEDFIEMSHKIINNETTDIPVNGLKVAKYQEFTNEITFYSISYHGLKEGDLVNIYTVYDSAATRVLQNATVTKLGNDEGNDKEYIFSIDNGGNKISLQWVELTTEDYKKKQIDVSGTTYTISSNKSCVSSDDGVIPVVNNWINADDTKRNVCFKKVVNGVEVEYYVRIFSRIPNWKFADNAVTEYNIYDNPDTKDTFLKKYQNLEYDFLSVNSDMAYAKTIYNDQVSQIVYTDDIDLSFLHDNLGRPLTEIFLTIIKNNVGFRYWYCDSGNCEYKEDKNEFTERIEYSHAFGKVNCAFKLSKYSLYDSGLTNILTIYNDGILTPNNENNRGKENISQYTGLSIIENSGLGINNRDEKNISTKYQKWVKLLENDEIDYYTDIHYYGDLCSYSTANAIEESIQMISHRFNTAQREARIDNNIVFVDDLRYDEIETDDWDYNQFAMSTSDEDTLFKLARQRKEGYYYKPHYQIKLHTFSSELSSEYPQSYRVRAFNVLNGFYKIMTGYRNYFEAGDKIVLLRTDTSETYEGRLLTTREADEMMPEGQQCAILDPKIFYCKFFNPDGTEKNDISISREEMPLYKILKPNSNNIPAYAKLMKDGGIRYAWRDVMRNGEDNSSQLEQFPFTNGALYVSPRINFFLRRQDPNKEIRKFTFNSVDLRPQNYPFDPDGNYVPADDINNYYPSIEIKC